MAVKESGPIAAKVVRTALPEQKCAVALGKLRCALAPGHAGMHANGEVEWDLRTSASLFDPEPMPSAFDAAKPAVWDMVIADATNRPESPVRDLVVLDMRARDEFGAKKYGTRLQPLNGRDSLVDAYQEALDLCVYMRGRLAERYDGLLAAHYADALNIAFFLRCLLEAEVPR